MGAILEGVLSLIGLGGLLFLSWEAVTPPARRPLSPPSAVIADIEATASAAESAMYAAADRDSWFWR